MIYRLTAAMFAGLLAAGAAAAQSTTPSSGKARDQLHHLAVGDDRQCCRENLEFHGD
jgi:hypothetical protein